MTRTLTTDPTKPRIIIFEPAAFAGGAAAAVIAAIASALDRVQKDPPGRSRTGQPAGRPARVSLMLAGGSTPRNVYRELARVRGMPWHSIDVWFGDERAVPPDHPESNFAMAKETLAPLGLDPAAIHRMKAESSDLHQAARDYENALPDAIDILLLGVGTDGHTASIFPGSPLLAVNDRDVAVAEGPVPPHTRMTITPRVIQRAHARIVMAAGASKADAVARALAPDANPNVCPAALARIGTWLLDRDAASHLSQT